MVVQPCLSSELGSIPKVDWQTSNPEIVLNEEPSNNTGRQDRGRFTSRRKGNDLQLGYGSF